MAYDLADLVVGFVLDGWVSAHDEVECFNHGQGLRKINLSLRIRMEASRLPSLQRLSKVSYMSMISSTGRWYTHERLTSERRSADFHRISWEHVFMATRCDRLFEHRDKRVLATLWMNKIAVRSYSQTRMQNPKSTHLRRDSLSSPLIRPLHDPLHQSPRLPCKLVKLPTPRHPLWQKPKEREIVHEPVPWEDRVEEVLDGLNGGLEELVLPFVRTRVW